MTYIGKTMLKKWLIDGIMPIIRPLKYKVVPRFGTTIIQKENDDFLYYLYISTNKWDYIGYSPFGNISIKKVGDTFSKVINDKDLEDGSLVLKLMPNYEYGTYGKEISSKEEINDILESFKKIFLEYYLPAFERYSDPKNVLELWDSLDEEGRTNHFFDPYNYTKILILSKLINEDKYENRKIETLELYEKLKATGKHYHLDKLENLEKVIRYIEENEI